MSSVSELVDQNIKQLRGFLGVFPKVEDNPQTSIDSKVSPVSEFMYQDLKQEHQEIFLPSKTRRSNANICKKRQPKRKSFKNALKKIKQQINPKMQLATSTVYVLDDLMNHVLELFEKEIKSLNRVQKAKTLTVKQLEAATKLCLPKMLRKKVIEYGWLAVHNGKFEVRK